MTSATPSTIPALRHWQPATGTFSLRGDAQVVVAAADAGALRPEAELLVRDLQVPAATTRSSRSVAIGASPGQS